MCAQWRAADAAFINAEAAREQVLVGWIALVLGFITMGAAIAAAGYARRAAVATEQTVAIASDAAAGAGEALATAARNADAATNLVRISEETAKRQLRAYVSLQSSGYSVAGSKGPIFVHVNFKNSGITPAYDFQVAADLFYVKKGEKAPERIAEFVGGSTILGPGRDGFMKDTLIVGAQEINQLRRGVGAFHVVGAVRYRDIYGRRHVYDFALESGADFGSGDLQVSSGKNVEQEEG